MEFLECLTHTPYHLKLLYFYIDFLKKKLNENHENKQDILHSIQYYAQITFDNDHYNFIPSKTLGETLFYLGKECEAAQYLSKALDIEESQPIISFDTIPLVFCPCDY